MKTKFIYTIILVVTCIINTQAQEKLFEKLATNNNITVVQINKALLELIPQMQYNPKAADIKQLTQNLDMMEIYNCSNDLKTITFVKSEMKEFAKTKTMESLMTIKDKGQMVYFYGNKQKDRYKNLILYMEETDNCTVIRITGNFTSNDIKNVIDNSTNKVK